MITPHPHGSAPLASACPGECVAAQAGAPISGGTASQNKCRHFLGLYPDNRPSCAMGRDVRAWAVRCNGGSSLGIGLRLPCTKQAEGADKPLFDCPELDRKTQEEVDKERQALSERMNRLIKALPAVNSMKRKMIAHNLSSAVATCPWCGEKDALQIGVALGVNNHVRCSCKSCGEGFIE